MIENWKKAYKFMVVWVLAAAGSLAGLEMFLPAFEGKVPPAVYACLMILGIVARVIRQRDSQTEESVKEELKRVKAIAKNAGLISIVVLTCLGCTEPRHPGRDQCYLLADSVAARAYATQCIDYPDTRVCPHGDAIEEQHGKDLEACK